jgi:hypothetical protein
MHPPAPRGYDAAGKAERLQAAAFFSRVHLCLQSQSLSKEGQSGPTSHVRVRVVVRAGVRVGVLVDFCFHNFSVLVFQLFSFLVGERQRGNQRTEPARDRVPEMGARLPGLICFCDCSRSSAASTAHVSQSE